MIRRARSNNTTIDEFKQRPRNFELVEACGIHFSSGEHPLSIRCHVTNGALGVLNPDIKLSVSWQELIWNNDNTEVIFGNPATCSIASDLNQIPADPATSAQQIVEEFNQSPSCNAAGLSAVYKIAVTGVFIDITYSPQSNDEMPMPGPQSTGT